MGSPDLVKVFASIGHVKVLEFLAENGESRITPIVNALSMNNKGIRKILDNLIELEIVQVRKYQDYSVYFISPFNEFGEALIQFLNSWKKEEA